MIQTSKGDSRLECRRPTSRRCFRRPTCWQRPSSGRLDGIVNKHNAVVIKVSHVVVDDVETVTHPLAKLAVQMRVRGVQSRISVSGAQKRVYRLNAPFMLSLTPTKTRKDAAQSLPEGA